MLQARIDLVFELFTVDRGTTSAGAGGVAGLQHEVWDYAVEDDVVVVATLGEGGEVGAGLTTSLSVRRRRYEDSELAKRCLHTLGAWLL